MPTTVPKSHLLVCQLKINMADTKTINLTSLVSKKTRRAKARLMQNLGKADKTTDELLDIYQINFNRQQSSALNLQKHVKHYLHCLKELHEASKGLDQCLMDLHEKDWPKHDTFENNTCEANHINQDLEEKVKETVLAPLEQYIGQFAEIRDKIAKRGRKLVDYDGQRHSFEALQQQRADKNHGDDPKIIRQRDQLEEARRVYESLNNELHEDLPLLYDNRIPFLITAFQRLFSSKLAYFNEHAKLQKSYLDTVEMLAKGSEKGEFNCKLSEYYSASSKTPSTASQNDKDRNTYTYRKYSNNGNQNFSKPVEEAAELDETSQRAAVINQKPPVYLHRVRSTYKYLAEDEDELSFEAGETIQVVEYDDPAEQEEGWLMGIKESTGQKGLFPANFTKQI